MNWKCGGDDQVLVGMSNEVPKMDGMQSGSVSWINCCWGKHWVGRVAKCGWEGWPNTRQMVWLGGEVVESDHCDTNGYSISVCGMALVNGGIDVRMWPLAWWRWWWWLTTGYSVGEPLLLISLLLTGMLVSVDSNSKWGIFQSWKGESNYRLLERRGSSYHFCVWIWLDPYPGISGMEPITAEISASKPISNDLLSFVTEVLQIPSSDAEENQLLLHFQVSPLLVEGNWLLPASAEWIQLPLERRPLVPDGQGWKLLFSTVGGWLCKGSLSNCGRGSQMTHERRAFFWPIFGRQKVSLQSVVVVLVVAVVRCVMVTPW